MKKELTSQTLDEFEQLLRIDSNSDNHASLKQAGEYVQKLLSDLPIDWETKKVGNSAEFFIGRTKEMDSGKPVFILSGHLDVVPEVKEPRQEGNYLYASGSSDMKGGLMTMVEVMRALHKDKLCKNIIIALNPEEEIGNPNHSLTLSELAKEGDFVMVFEGDEEKGLDKKTLVKSRKGAWVYKLTLEAQKDLPPGVLIERSLRLVNCLNSCVDYEAGTTVNIGQIYEEYDSSEHGEIPVNLVEIELVGPGGHSGNLDTPDKRHSTINMMTDVLLNLIDEEREGGCASILSFSGGSKVNVIPTNSRVILTSSDAGENGISQMAEQIEGQLKKLSETSEKSVVFKVSEKHATETPRSPERVVIKGEYRFRTSQEDERVKGEFQACVEGSSTGGVEIMLEEIGKFPALEENKNTPEYIAEVENIAKLLGVQVTFEDRAGAPDANHFSFGKEGIVVLDGFGPQGEGEHTDRERVDLRSIGVSIEFAKNIIKSKLADS